MVILLKGHKLLDQFLTSLYRFSTYRKFFCNTFYSYTCRNTIDMVEIAFLIEFNILLLAIAIYVANYIASLVMACMATVNNYEGNKDHA